MFLVLVLATSAQAQNTCSAKGVMGGQPFTLTHCAVAFYESEHSVTLWLTDSAISEEELQRFQWSSDSWALQAQHRRTMIQMDFCPGGGKPQASADAVKAVAIQFRHAKIVLPGPQDQWVFSLPEDREIKIHALRGNLQRGGALSGKITGGVESAGHPFSWDIDFDVVLPMKAAGAGLGCGS